MMYRHWLPVAVAAPLMLGGCGALGEAMTAHTDVVARAAGKELKVEDAAKLLAVNPQIPADPQIVRALADVWIDYILLGTAVAEDATLASFNLDPLMAPMREQRIVMRLRDQVIRPDTVFTDAQLLEAWASEGPGTEVRARHILLRLPADASPAQREEIRGTAEQLRQRAIGGEDFAALAQQYSEDPGSGARGGDLEYFGRGRMVAPFEEAAFALQPGQISEVVESPFGYHIIKVEDRRQQDLGDQQAQFRQFLVDRRVQEAEMAYLDSLSAASNVQVQPQGLAIVKEIAANPSAALRGRAGSRPIVTYTGGAFTSGDFAKFIQTAGPQMQGMFAQAPDEQLDGVIKQLAQKELLLREAANRGITLSPEEEEEFRRELRSSLQMVVTTTGFTNADLSTPNAVESFVSQLLEGAVSGQIQLMPIGQLSQHLRETYRAEINDAALNAVVARMEAIRAAQGTTMPSGSIPGLEDHSGHEH
jgi:parvulin-like peptidyl-prolyl isomerase